MYIRTLAAILLSALLTAAASSQPAAKESNEPKKVGGKFFGEWLKLAEGDKDSSVREQALQTVMSFPAADIRKEKDVVARLIKRMEIEPDTGVKLVAMDLVSTLVAEKLIDKNNDVAEIARVFAANVESNLGPLRLHGIQGLGRLGPKAHGKIGGLMKSEPVFGDASFEVRVAFVQMLGQCGFTEENGPDLNVLKRLAGASAQHGAKGGMARDSALPVRLQSLQSLFVLGPPWDTSKTSLKKDPKEPPAINDKEAQIIADLIKTRISGPKSSIPESNKQAEIWCRLVIVRFSSLEELAEQRNGIAAHLNDEEDAVKYQALAGLRMLGEHAEPVLPLVLKQLAHKEFAIREAALLTLAAIGDKGIPTVISIIDNPREEPEMRAAALRALATLGERAEKGRPSVVAVIKDPSLLKDPTPSGIALLRQACLALAAMGVKAQPEIPTLQDLSNKMIEIRDARLKGEDYKKWLSNPETQRFLKNLKPEEREELFKNHPEDQFKKFIDDAIEFVKKSTEGHPGGPPKKQ